MADEPGKNSRDWLRSPLASALAWWIPLAALFAGLLAPMAVRTTVWIVALLWMGTSCVLNARRCGRTHCRYTGPYYLAMIAPVTLMGFRLIPSGFYAWLVLGVVILLGSRLLWWATERAWGRFS